MNQQRGPRRPGRWIVLGTYVVAALVGSWFGFDFGHTLSGPGLGVVLAALGALLCSIVLGDAVERLLGRLPGRRRDG